MIFGDPLKKALDSHDPAVRAGAVRTVGQQQKKEHFGRLLEMLQHEETELKIEVATALGLLGEPVSIAPLAALLSSSDRRLRAAAAQAMHKIQAANPKEGLLRPSDFVFGDPGVTFLLIVLDVFGIQDKGTIATGILGTGSIAVGDRLVLRKADGRNLETVCDGIERVRRDVPSPGENLGVFLRGLSMADIGEGDSLVKEEHAKLSRIDEASDSYERTYTRYRHLAIADAKPAPTEQEIQEIEELLGARLPLSFREYLKVANGGYLEYAIDVPTGTGETERLSFCGLFEAGTSSHESFVDEIRDAQEQANIPKGVLPFAQDEGGSVVYLDLTPEGNGRVVTFVEGLPECGLMELASSFDEYVDKLDAQTTIGRWDKHENIYVQIWRQALTAFGWPEDRIACLIAHYQPHLRDPDSLFYHEDPAHYLTFELLSARANELFDYSLGRSGRGGPWELHSPVHKILNRALDWYTTTFRGIPPRFPDWEQVKLEVVSCLAKHGETLRYS